MKIRALKIKKFKNLEDFEIHFSDADSVNLIIGKNGSGKSNLLKAITLIFSQIYRGIDFTFDFELKYECRGAKIEINAKAGNSEFTQVLINGEEISYSQLRSSISSENKSLLPNNIVVYYSGMSQEMQEITQPHARSFRNKLIKGQSSLDIRDIFYFEPLHFELILLTFFSKDYKDEFLENFNIKEFINCKIKFTNDAKKAKGNVLNVINRIKTIENKRREIIIDKSELIRIKEDIGGIFEDIFFKTFDGILIGGYIDSISIQFSLSDDSIINSSDLSDGEKQLISIQGLTSFLKEKETLFLFDEPDTYMHLVWQAKFISSISDLLYKNNMQAIVTTHSPQLLSNLKEGTIFLIENGNVDYSTKFYGRDIKYITLKMGGENRPKIIQNKLERIFNQLASVNSIKKLIQIKNLYNEIVPLIENSDADSDLIEIKTEIDYLEEDLVE